MRDLERITERVTRSGHPDDPNTPIYLLTLDEYFTGNNVVGSIGCNLADVQEPSQLWNFLKKIEKNTSVTRVCIQITAFDDPDWPFSDSVWIISDASVEVARSWFPEELAPDDIWIGWNEDLNYENIEIESGFSPICCWWD